MTRLLSLAALLLAARALCAQAPSGEIRLQVNDPTGAPMQASGMIENAPSNVQANFQTDAQGFALLPNLPFGRYRVDVSSPGFVTQSVQIEVRSTAAVTRIITMPLASQSAQVQVVATTPLPGIELPLDEIPAPVETATQTDIANSAALDLGDFMNRRLNGVYINEMEENPFQLDVNYRGYTASPLLGTPEGLSVYVDGVRQNQPFGDVVSWDLIAMNAISEMALVPGSNPTFGLNTLGGSISVTTKSGITNPGWAGKLLYGSSGRKQLEAEWGGMKPSGFNWFFSTDIFHESGWRFDSPSDLKQGFGRLGWHHGNTDLALTMSFAYNTLTGMGLEDYRLLQMNYSSVYTIPDITNNRSPSFNFIARHQFTDNLTFSGNMWYRWIRTETINGNANNDAFAGPVSQLTPADLAALAAAGYTGFPTNGVDASAFPSWACIANALEGNDADHTCDGLNIYSKEIQNDFGLSGQFTWVTRPWTHRNQVTAGALFDRGTVAYTQNTQYGYIDNERVIVGVPAWQDGSTNIPINSAVNLHGITPNGSFYLTDTFALAKNWNVTTSGRYNRSVIDNTDLLNRTQGPGSLTGDYTFGRFNPAIGMTYSPLTWLNLYANYSQANRAPTSIELGCADPNNPCSLPNALASDPPLSQVVTHTWEAGLRGKLEQFHTNWNVGAFRAENHNDILFVASQITGTGYFQNFAKTLRHGVQASLDEHLQRVAIGLDWTLLSATYQSAETLDGTANSTSDLALSGYPGIGGIISVHPGNRIPLIPKQTGKAYLDLQATSKLFIDIDVIANSSSYVRGNENNAYQPDPPYYLGSGVTPGYAVLNAMAHYDLTRHFQLGLQIDNLLDRRYYTAGQLANTIIGNDGLPVFQPFPAYPTGPQAGSYPLTSATFFAAGAPRRAWVYLTLKF